MENLTSFDFYLKFTKPLILNFPKISDRALAAAWVKKISNDSAGEESVRLEYLKLLLFVLQRKTLTPPFTQHPNELQTLEKFPKDRTLVDVARTIIRAENAERRQNFEKRLRGEHGDQPPYISDFSADLLEYVAFQNIENFGVHGYYAVSKSPLNLWSRVDRQLLPKAAKSALQVTAPPSNLTEDYLTPKQEIPLLGQKAPPPVKKIRKSTLGTSPPSCPLGKLATPPDDRDPPTWGTNLLDAKFLEEEVGAETEMIFSPAAFADLDDEEMPSFFDTSGEWSPPAPPYPYVTPPPAIRVPKMGIPKLALSKSKLPPKREIRRPKRVKKRPMAEEPAGRPVDDVESYLEERGRQIAEFEANYREDLIQDSKEEERRGISALPIKKPKVKRQISRLVKFSGLQIPKSHAAPVELDKSIHVSPETRQILEDIIEGPSTSTGVTRLEPSILRHPEPKLLHHRRATEEEEEDSRLFDGIQEADGIFPAEMDAPPHLGSRSKDPRLLEDFNRMLDLAKAEVDLDNYEAMERMVEEEMRQAGTDPHAKRKRRISRRELDAQRRRLLDVHRLADAQLEELMTDEAFQAAEDFVEEANWEPEGLSPPIDPETLKRTIQMGYAPPPQLPYRRALVPGRRPVQRYSHGPRIRPIQEAEYEPPAYLTQEDFVLRDRLAEHEPITERRTIRFPFRRTRTVRRHSSPPELDVVREERPAARVPLQRRALRRTLNKKRSDFSTATTDEDRVAVTQLRTDIEEEGELYGIPEASVYGRFGTLVAEPLSLQFRYL